MPQREGGPPRHLEPHSPLGRSKAWELGRSQQSSLDRAESPTSSLLSVGGGGTSLSHSCHVSMTMMEDSSLASDVAGGLAVA